MVAGSASQSSVFQLLLLTVVVVAGRLRLLAWEAMGGADGGSSHSVAWLGVLAALKRLCRTGGGGGG